MLQLQEELEGKGLSRAIVDGLLADRRAALTAEVEADMAAKPGNRCCTICWVLHPCSRSCCSSLGLGAHLYVDGACYCQPFLRGCRACLIHIPDELKGEGCKALCWCVQQQLIQNSALEHMQHGWVDTVALPLPVTKCCQRAKPHQTGEREGGVPKRHVLPVEVAASPAVSRPVVQQAPSFLAAKVVTGSLVTSRTVGVPDVCCTSLYAFP